MARRATVNKTGFANKEGVNHKEAWVCFPCLNCGATVKANIGLSLPTLEEAMGNCVWLCPECGYEHSILSDIPDSMDNLAKTEHSHPLGMVVFTHFRCGKGVKRGLKNGALPFKID